jgi:fused signal recognition particle receptor
MQTSKNLMDQISKITNVIKPDFKIFVGDSLAGNDTVNQAREFYEHTKFDGSILTKSDADARGGAALSIVKVTSTPILYVGVGQEYDDLEEFSKDSFLKTVFGNTEIVDEIPTTEISQYVQETQGETKEKPIPEIKETQPEPESKEEISITESEIKSSNDPFEGIDTDDINQYVAVYDLKPPESDEQAKVLAKRIKEWIASGRPKP